MNTPSFSDCVKKLGVDEQYVLPIGRNKAKISLDVLKQPATPGKLILVSAITPTPSGEGKTTVSVGLAQGLQAIGKKACLALRQPSMGPVFGRKGGATGGGKSSLTPMEEINMHFTGDFHAITSAHNLISAILDNAMFFRTINIDERKVTWKRVMDMNDRSLRSIMVGMNKQGFPRETGFDITPASEIMACLCLATSYKDMEDRVNRIVIGFTTDDKPVYAGELGITGSVMALLKDALMPNLVQSLEGVPCFLHGGPFANIAHGCNSVLATKMALHFGDYAVTEAGFAFDLGAEKFLDIKCRQAGLSPSAIVIVATARALKMHGGAALADLKNTDVDALKKGLANLDAHLDAATNYKRPVVVAINKFFDDSQEELDAILEHCKERGVACAIADIFSEGGEGGRELAQLVVEAADTPSPEFKPLYETTLPVIDKLNAIARNIYGADGVELTLAARKRLAQFEASGLTDLPICMAKTQNSLSDNGKLRGRPSGFTVTVRDFEIANGAGFLVALCGEILRMPALPITPNATKIHLDENGNVIGL
ncbi:MAG: formate--tetrahydrofolate ligase [Akkermansia sp.]|nr:formate--tetrahydrofolate ligase [Akkermansia sp.]